jgi:hypothetical protein
LVDPSRVWLFALLVAVKARERDKLERLCRYITRPAVSEKRLLLTALRIPVKLDSRYNTLRPARRDDDVMFLGGGLTRSPDRRPRK